MAVQREIIAHTLSHYLETDTKKDLQGEHHFPTEEE